MAERHLRVWILVLGSTSASLSTADMSLPNSPVSLLLSRLRDENHPPQQATSADAPSADVTGALTLVCVGRWEAWNALQVGDLGLLEDCSDGHAALCSEEVVLEAAARVHGKRSG